MSTTSYWIASQPGHDYAPLDADGEVDVAIVGGGITGVTAALLLARQGKRVALIEARRIGELDTGATTAHLTALLDTRYHTLISDFGEEGAALAAKSQRAAIDRIEAFVREEALDCEFARVSGYLYAEPGQDEKEVEKEAEAAKKVGLDARLVTNAPLPFPVARALEVGNQAQFHVLRYLRPLAERFVAAGGRIYERTRVTSIEDGQPCVVTTETGRVLRARDVVVATSAAVSNRFVLHTHVYAYRSYAIAMRVPSASSGLFWDVAEPYHYTRSQPCEGGQLLIVGGEDHKTGTKRDTDEAFAALEVYARQHFGDHAVAYKWSGQVLETADGLPFIGKNPLDEHVYVATGYSGNGMTHGTLAAMLLTELVQGRESEWAALYDPSRKKPLASAKEFVIENAGVAAHMIGDRLKKSDAADFDEVKPGQGKLVTHHGARLAVYRDASGVLSTCSAVCPHLGCLVQWNEAETSWDCPCHGSRFEATGAVLNGPSVSPLARKEV